MNRKIPLTILVTLLGGQAFDVAAYQQIPVDIGAWNDPIASMTTDPCCTYDSSIYRLNWGVGHTGVDLGMGTVSVGDNVKAIGAGTIIARKRHCNGSVNTLNESVVLVRHQSANGTSFTAVYGHTNPTGVSCDGSTNKYTADYSEIGVTAGQILGTTGKYGDPHLHLGISTSDRDTILAAWGRYTGTVIPSHWKNPETYLQANAPLTLSLSSYFDGTGSLVDPRAGQPNSGSACVGQNGNGCWNDLVKLHPHDVPSTALFQVVGVKGVCESVDFKGLNGGANVEIRSWSGYGVESRYYKLDSLPAVVPLKHIVNTDKSADSWNLISLTTTAPVPLGSTRLIEATCVSYVDKGANVHEVAGVPTQFGSGYYWGGNGSLIGHSDSQESSDAIAGYGKSVDVAVLMRDHSTISALQVTKYFCGKLKFTTPVQIKLSWKAWDSPNWLGSQTINNGDVLTLPSSISNWAVLLIQASATNANNSRVTATCQ